MMLFGRSFATDPDVNKGGNALGKFALYNRNSELLYQSGKGCQAARTDNTCHCKAVRHLTTVFSNVRALTRIALCWLCWRRLRGMGNSLDEGYMMVASAETEETTDHEHRTYTPHLSHMLLTEYECVCEQISRQGRLPRSSREKVPTFPAGFYLVTGIIKCAFV